MEEVDRFFNEIVKDYRGKTPGDKVIERAEKEFTGFSEEHQSRQQEKLEIKEEMKILRKRLKSLKNTKNVRKRTVNQVKADKRNKIKKKIGQLQVRLQEIADEEANINY